MAHLLDSLEAGKDIGHYGRLVFAMIARHFLSHDELLARLTQDPDFSETEANTMLQQVEQRVFEARYQPVAECDAEVSAVAQTPGDGACQELLEVHSTFYGGMADVSAFYTQMTEARRLVVRLRVRRLYGVLLDKPPGT